jgi:hypothetical protein
MRKLSILIFALLVLAACASTVKAPIGKVPSRKELQTNANGGWIKLKLRNGVALQGELIVASGDSLFVLVDTLTSVSMSIVVEATLIIYKTHPNYYWSWTGFGAVTALSHGYFSVISLPLWAITGITTFNGESRRKNFLYYGEWNEFYKYSRFPQGWPEGVRRDMIKSKREK